MPNVRLDLIVAETDDALTKLRAGSIEVAVVVGEPPDGLPSDGFYRRHLLSIRSEWCCRAGTRWQPAARSTSAGWPMKGGWASALAPGIAAKW